MERNSIVLLVILCNAFFQTAESCLQNLPWYEDQRRDARRLPDEIQAIVPAYSFSCYGYVTQWGAYVDPPHNPYQVEFQVWRPQSADGNYELIGSNTHSELFPSNGQVILPVEQQFQIQVEPGDIVGFYANHLNLSRGRNQRRSEGGIELGDEIRSVTVWYDRVSYQEYSPGHELQQNELMSSTLGAPVITAAVVTSVVQVQATSSSSQHTSSSSQVINTPNMEVLVSINTRAPEEDSEDMSGGAPQNIFIFAAVGGGASLVFAIAAIAGTCACVARRRRKANKTRDITDGVGFNHIQLHGNEAYMAPQNQRRINTYLTHVPLVSEEQHVQHGCEVSHLVYDIRTPTDDNHVYDYVDGGPYALANAPDTYDTTAGSGYVINQLEYEDTSPISIPPRNETETEDGIDSEYIYADPTIGNGTGTEGGTEPEYAEPMVGNETPLRIVTPQPYEKPVSITSPETVAGNGPSGKQGQ